MKKLIIAVASVLACAWHNSKLRLSGALRRDYGPCFANAGGTVSPDGSLTRRADAVITTRYLLGKSGTDVDHVAVCGATDLPLGVIQDESAAIEDPVNVQLLGANSGTVRMVASEVIALGAYVYTAASGKIQDAPTGTTVYRVGIARQAATADGHVIEVEPCFPTSVTFA